MPSREQQGHISKARERIRSGMVLQRLLKYYNMSTEEAKEYMSPEQVRLGLALLKKTLPDLSAQTVVVHDARDKNPRDMSLQELYDECVNSIQENSTSSTQH